MKAASVFLCSVFIVLASSDLTGASNCNYLGKSLEPGTHTIECVQVVCGNDGMISENRCPQVAVLCAAPSMPSYQPGDLSKPFPDCCGFPKCV